MSNQFFKPESTSIVLSVLRVTLLSSTMVYVEITGPDTKTIRNEDTIYWYTLNDGNPATFPSDRKILNLTPGNTYTIKVRGGVNRESKTIRAMVDVGVYPYKGYEFRESAPYTFTMPSRITPATINSVTARGSNSLIVNLTAASVANIGTNLGDTASIRNSYLLDGTSTTGQPNPDGTVTIAASTNTSHTLQISSSLIFFVNTILQTDVKSNTYTFVPITMPPATTTPVATTTSTTPYSTQRFTTTTNPITTVPQYTTSNPSPIPKFISSTPTNTITPTSGPTPTNIITTPTSGPTPTNIITTPTSGPTPTNIITTPTSGPTPTNTMTPTSGPTPTNIITTPTSGPTPTNIITTPTSGPTPTNTMTPTSDPTSFITEAPSYSPMPFISEAPTTLPPFEITTPPVITYSTEPTHPSNDVLSRELHYLHNYIANRDIEYGAEESRPAVSKKLGNKTLLEIRAEDSKELVMVQNNTLILGTIALAVLIIGGIIIFDK